MYHCATRPMAPRRKSENLVSGTGGVKARYHLTTGAQQRQGPRRDVHACRELFQKKEKVGPCPSLQVHLSSLCTVDPTKVLRPGDSRGNN